MKSDGQSNGLTRTTMRNGHDTEQILREILPAAQHRIVQIPGLPHFARCNEMKIL